MFHKRREGVYEGEYKRAILGLTKCFHGKGKLVFPDGSVYDGLWEDNKRSGSGVMIWPDGHRYEGEWSDDKCSGSGHMIFEDQGSYIGEFQADEFHGRGR